MKRKGVYSLEKEGKTAELHIYGEIYNDDVSAKNIVQEIKAMKDVSIINVYICSYGGEVAQGAAIYNALRRHKAKVKTYCDGMACSIASVIFMAGDERIMYDDGSLLMIHNAWSMGMGNANDFRKQADDLDKINQIAIEAYKAHSSLEEDEIKKLMDAETWILPKEAIEYGFATSIEKMEDTEKASQSAKLQIFNLVKAHQETTDEEENNEDDVDDVDDVEEPQEPTTEEPTEEPETDEDTSDDTEETDGDVTIEDESETEDNSDDDTDETAQEKMCSFFNAILKM
jgi:ATP-dependent Clp protease protease subunit